MTSSLIPINAHTSESYSLAVKAALGKGYHHAALIYSEWFRSGKVTGAHPAFKNALQLLEEILSITAFDLLSISKQVQQGEIIKFLTHLPDSYEIESVIIPMKFGWSLCVSSQVGCRMGCTFCQTGKMGLIRHLSTQEIVSQLFNARYVLGFDIRNIVFMGMGEPMDNFDAVIKTIEIFTDPFGFGIGKRHVTISTSGRIDGIKRMIKEVDPAVNLAVSVNAPNDEIRTKLMPLNRKYSMANLHAAMQEYCAHPRRSILVEYVLLKDLTDSLDDADQLADYLQGLKVKINLIPYNPQRPDRYQPPSQEVQEAFSKRLRQKGYYTLFRHTKGNQIMAACGQLGNADLKAKRSTSLAMVSDFIHCS